MAVTTHYETLGISPEATQAEIIAAWRRAASRRHPDKGNEESEAAFHAARQAYEILRDPVKREEYDLAGVVVDTRNLETEAVDYVGELFTQLLAAEFDVIDPVAEVRIAIRKQIRTTEGELVKAQRMFERARRRRHTVRRKTEGHDVFAAIAKSSVMATYAQVQHIKHGTKVFARALEIVAEYENGPPPEVTAPKTLLRIGLTTADYSSIGWGDLR